MLKEPGLKPSYLKKSNRGWMDGLVQMDINSTGLKILATIAACLGAFPVLR